MTTTLKDKGFRFLVNPDLSDSNWVHPADIKFADWIDCTDMDDAQFDAFMEIQRMNASLPTRSVFGTLLKADYDHHGLTLDLYGTVDDEDGYRVLHVCIPRTLVSMTECLSLDLMSYISSVLDDTMPTAEELRREHADEARAERAAHNRAMRN